MEIVIDTDGPQVHWLMGNYGVTPCGMAAISPTDPPTSREEHGVTCAKCLRFVAQTSKNIFKCPGCDRFWKTEEWRDLHALSHE